MRSAAERGALPPAILGLDADEPPTPEPRRTEPAPTQQRRRPGSTFFFAGGDGSGF
ncbi:hypothetical protein [Flindersiella endophytica]